MKIPFDIKYKPQIESGEYKVKTRDGKSARIICWNRHTAEPYDGCILVVLVTLGNNSESAYYYYQDGHLWNKSNGEGDSHLDLFIITPDPELRELEDERIRKSIADCVSLMGEDGDVFSNHNVTKVQVLAWLEKQKEEEGYEAVPVESTLEYKLGFKAGKESEKQKEQNPLTDFEAAIYSYLSDDTSGKFDKEVMHKCAIERAKILLELARKEQKPAEPELKIPDWVHGSWDDEYMINTVIGRYSLHAEVAKKRGDTHDYNLSKSMENWLRNVVKPLILKKQKEPEKDAETQWENGTLIVDCSKQKLSWSEEDVKRLYSIGTQIGFLKGKYSEYQKDIDWIYALAEKMGFHKCKIGEVVTEWKKENIDDKMLSKPKQEWSEDFDEEVEKIHKRYPEVSFAKLTRIAYHFSKWANRCKDIEWNEEDEKIRQSIIKDIEFERNYTYAETGKVIEKYNEQINWLKILSLNRKKINEDVEKLCSNEWSEEDEAFLKVAIAICNKYSHKDIADWLKSRRPSWKPKHCWEQMEWTDTDLEEFTENVRHIITDKLTTISKNASGCEISCSVAIDDKTAREIANAIIFCIEPYPHWKPSEEKKKETLDGADIGYGLETAIDILENGFTHYQTDDGEYERKQALDVLIFLLNETRKKEDTKLWSKDIVESIATWAKEKFQIYSMKESTPYVEAVKNNAQKVLDWAKEQWPIYFGWKPSEEQMDALKNSAYGTYQNGDGPALRELYNQLKKLM